jgi:hypothetical protein
VFMGFVAYHINLTTLRPTSMQSLIAWTRSSASSKRSTGDPPRFSVANIARWWYSLPVVGVVSEGVVCSPHIVVVNSHTMEGSTSSDRVPGQSLMKSEIIVGCFVYPCVELNVVIVWIEFRVNLVLTIVSHG